MNGGFGISKKKKKKKKFLNECLTKQRLKPVNVDAY